MVRFFRVLFCLAAILSFTMAVLPNPPSLPGSPSDKLMHILAFTCLAGLAVGAFPRVAAWKLVVALSAFGAVIELFQMIPRLHRTAEGLDWLADTAAVVTVVVAFRLWRLARTRMRAARA